MTVPEPSHRLRPEQFQVPFRTDTPRASFLSQLPVRQTSTSAMPSSALLAPLKQENIQPQTTEGREHFFDVVRGSPSGPSDLSFMDYDYPFQPPTFSNYEVAASSHPHGLPNAISFESPLRIANQYPYADLVPCQYTSPDYDRTCPRAFSGLGPDQLSDVCFPPGYQFPGQHQSFCFPNHVYQEPSQQLECPMKGQTPPDGPQHVDTSYYATPTSQCLPFRDSPDHRLHQQFGQAPHGDRSGFENEQDDKSDDKNEPYAKLIYRALMERPDRTMVLRDIYAWFQCHTDKPKDSNTKGWQNSIRHNLSMNGAFQKVEQPTGEDSKKANMWRLTEEAIREGVKSTTRYRKKEQQKRGPKFSHNSNHRPSAQRQAAGARGGDATKRSTEKRQVQQRQRTEQELFDHGLGITCETSVAPDVEPCSPFMLGPTPGEPAPSYGYALRGLSDNAEYMQHRSAHSRNSSLSPANPTPYQSFPQSPAQDQCWGCNTMSDVSSLFAPTIGYFAGGPLDGGCLELAPSNAPSPSDGDDPPTPIHNPEGLDVDLNGHLVPPAPTDFFEAEGAMM